MRIIFGLWIFLIMITLVIGCGKETPAQKNTKQQNDIPKQKSNSETGENIVKTKHIEKKKILTAEEQMKQYYAQKGIPYPTENNTTTAIKDSKVFSEQNSLSQDNYINDNNSHTLLNNEENSAFEPIKNSPADNSGNKIAIEENNNTLQSQISNKSAMSSQDNNIQQSLEEETKPDEPVYSDSEPPQLLSIQFSPQKVAPGKEVTILVTAKDNLSGVDTIYGVLKSPVGTAILSFGCPNIMQDGSFAGTVKVPDRAADGMWYVQSINISDKVHNTKNYSLNDPIVRNYYLEVLKSDSDIDPPELTGVYLTPKETNGGERISILVDARDDKSGVQGAYGVMLSPSKNARLPFACQLDKELNTYAGFIDVPKDAESGYWTLDYLRLDDTAKNSKSYYPKDKPAIFDNAKLNVYSKNSDSEGPVLENIEIYPVSVTYEETVEFIVRASDNISGIEIITARIKSPANAFFNVYFEYVADKDYYTGKLFIPKNSTVGTWSVDGITLIDKARNVTDCFKHNNNLIGQAIFDVIGE